MRRFGVLAAAVTALVGIALALPAAASTPQSQSSHHLVASPDNNGWQ